MLLAQLIGTVAAVLGLCSYLHRQDKRFKLQVGLSSWIWGVHFGLLGAGSAMYTQFAIGTRSWFSIGEHSQTYRHSLFWLSSLILIALAWLGWDGWISLPPLAAAINSTAALIYAENRAMRMRLLISSALWIGTGLYWLSWPLVFTELLAVSLNLRTIYRLSPQQPVDHAAEG